MVSLAESVGKPRRLFYRSDTTGLASMKCHAGEEFVVQRLWCYGTLESQRQNREIQTEKQRRREDALPTRGGERGNYQEQLSVSSFLQCVVRTWIPWEHERVVSQRTQYLYQLYSRIQREPETAILSNPSQEKRAQYLQAVNPHKHSRLTSNLNAFSNNNTSQIMTVFTKVLQTSVCDVASRQGNCQKFRTILGKD